MKHFFSLLFVAIFCFLLPVWALAEMVDGISIESQLWSQIQKESNPRESLVGRYYAVDDMYRTMLSQTGTVPSNTSIIRTKQLRDALRLRVDQQKESIKPYSRMSGFLAEYRSGVLTSWSALDKPCPQMYQLADDRSYALDIPTSLTLATWLMESGCGRYRPGNGDGIFQIVSQDYGTGVMTTGLFIVNIYDFHALSSNKRKRWQKIIGWQPITMSYSDRDYETIVRHGSLYNGLSWSWRQGIIQPWAPSYVFGKLNNSYSWAKKDWLLVRMMKVMQYELGQKK